MEIILDATLPPEANMTVIRIQKRSNSAQLGKKFFKAIWDIKKTLREGSYGVWGYTEVKYKWSPIEDRKERKAQGGDYLHHFYMCFSDDADFFLIKFILDRENGIRVSTNTVYPSGTKFNIFYKPE